MSNWNLLNQCRITPKQDRRFGSEPADGFNGFFCLILNGMKVKCVVSDGEGWQHVSVSIEGHTSVIPSWSIMCQVKDLFWEPLDWVVQFHPAQSDYVNDHPGVLHLWRPLLAVMPTPPANLVGIKNREAMQELMADESVPLRQREEAKAVHLLNKAIGTLEQKQALEQSHLKACQDDENRKKKAP